MQDMGREMICVQGFGYISECPAFFIDKAKIYVITKNTIHTRL